MKTTGRSVYNLANRRAIHFVVFLVMLLTILLHGPDAHAGGLIPDEIRIGTGIAKFDDAARRIHVQ